jgi:hypothetical protein
MASTGQIPWPSPGNSHGRQRATFMTVYGQVLLAVESRRYLVNFRLPLTDFDHVTPVSMGGVEHST